jgi:hypothetical protein
MQAKSLAGVNVARMFQMLITYYVLGCTQAAARFMVTIWESQQTLAPTGVNYLASLLTKKF